MLFVNYAKLKRKLESTVSGMFNQGLVNTDVEYGYDDTGNPHKIQVTSGTQIIQNTIINRDKYNRTKQINFDGYLTGSINRQLDDRNYNVILESNHVCENSKVINELVYSHFIHQGLSIMYNTITNDSLKQVQNTYTNANFDQLTILDLVSVTDQTMIDNIREFSSLYRKTGRKLYMYTYTDFTNRPPQDIINDINKMITNYPELSGVYIDQISLNQKDLTYYTELIINIHELSSELKIITNTMDKTNIDFFDISDYVVIYNDTLDNFDDTIEDDMLKDTLSQSIIMIHNANTDAMKRLVKKLKSRFIFLTDDDNSPSFYLDEVSAMVNKLT